MVDDLATKGIEFTTAKQIFGQDLKGLMAMVGGGSGGVMYSTSRTTHNNLNWNYTNPNTGAKAIDHVKLHERNELSKKIHGVFHGSAKKQVENAWRKNPNAKPIVQGNREVYILKQRNSGFEGGYEGSGKQLDYVTVVVEQQTGDIITAFPSYEK